MNTKEFVRVNNLWPTILNDYGLPPITGKNHYKGKCPLCESLNAFRIDNKGGNGTWICKCGSGSGWELLIATTQKSYAEITKEIDQAYGNNFTGTKTPVTEEAIKLENRKKRLRNLFRQSKKPSESMIKDYLYNRGIHDLPVKAISAKEGVFNRNFNCTLDLMLSLATNDAGETKYIHITYLENGYKTKRMEKPKILYSLFNGELYESVAIRMFPLASSLGIAEGIETALAAKQLYGVNTWATLNTSIMMKFVAPKGVDTLFIFADADDNAAGEKAAYAVANKNLMANNDVKKVIIRFPEFGDFCDVLTTPRPVYERRFPLDKRL